MSYQLSNYISEESDTDFYINSKSDKEFRRKQFEVNSKWNKHTGKHIHLIQRNGAGGQRHWRKMGHINKKKSNITRRRSSKAAMSECPLPKENKKQARSWDFPEYKFNQKPKHFEKQLKKHNKRLPLKFEECETIGSLLAGGCEQKWATPRVRGPHRGDEEERRESPEYIEFLAQKNKS